VKHILALGVALLLLAGCGTSNTETIKHDPMADTPPIPPPPAGFTKVRAAVIEFQDKTQRRGWYVRPIGDQGGEKFETIAVNSNRFNMINRMRLADLKKEQSEIGTIDPSEIAKAGRVRGVDYMFFGAITNFSVKITKTDKGFGAFKHLVGPLAPVDIDTSKTTVETVVDVDISLVNTTTAEIVAKQQGAVKKETVASAWGMKIFDIGGTAKNEVKIDEDSQGRILQWALDESFRKMLPTIDSKFSQPLPSYCPTCKTELPSGQKFCTKCGKGIEPQGCAKCGAKLEVNAKFCGGCGAKVEPPKPAGEDK
jgi:curli biogenesis system outer membrane secretion channel CsgG